MKRSTLFTGILATAMLLTVGSLSYGATIDHKTEMTSSFAADLGGYLDAPVFIVTGLATLEAEILITQTYPYAGEVKKYAVKTSAKRTSLFRMARDAIS